MLFVFLSSFAFTPLVYADPVTRLQMTSQPGDYIGGGRQYLYTPADGAFTSSAVDFNGDGIADFVTILFDPNNPGGAWHLAFGTNRLGLNLAPGFYPDAERAFFASPGHPGLDVGGDSRGCNRLRGSFTILNVTSVNNGGPGGLPAVTSFAATFEQHCEDFAPALFGTILYNSEVAPDPVPEPTTIILLGTGLFGIGAGIRKKRNKSE